MFTELRCISVYILHLRHATQLESKHDQHCLIYYPNFDIQYYTTQKRVLIL